MRKDVKLGFAIGGVLLAVAIVFALVNSRPKVTTDVVDDTTPPAQNDSIATDTGAGKTDSNKAADVKATDSKAGDTKTATVTPTPADPAKSATADAGAAKASDGKTDASNTGDSLFKNSNSATDWDKSFTTGTPVMAANQTVKLPDSSTLPSPVSQTSGVSTAKSTGPVKINAPGFAYVNHTQQGDADEAVKTAGSKVTPTAKADITSTSHASSTHAIKSGETFSTIAAAYYGNSRYYKLIAAANPKVDPTHLKIGQVITLPALDAKAETAKTAPTGTTSASEKPIDPKTQYRVQSGDNLHRICVKLYGDASKVDALYEANKAAIGSDPAKLKLGMVLTLPTAPSVKS